MNLGNLGLYYISKFTQAYKADSYGFSREIFVSFFTIYRNTGSISKYLKATATDLELQRGNQEVVKWIIF